MESKTTLLILALLLPCHGLITDENEARTWLDSWNTEASRIYPSYWESSWRYQTNMTDHNQQLGVAASVTRSLFDKEAGKNASLFDWQNFQNETLRRLFSKLSVIGTAKLEEEQIERVDQLRSEMQKIYSTGQVCLQPDDCHQMDPGITRLLLSSRDSDTLEKVWKDWRDVTGKRMRTKYKEFVDLNNKAAILNGFSDTGEYWRSKYEMDGFQEEVNRLWEEVRPLYLQLHAYARRRLKEAYPEHDFPSTGHIPAHLMSNMWAQEWTGLVDIMIPFPNSSAVDITQALVDQGYTVDRLLRTSESFFTSLGLEAMPDSFWTNSMFVRPEDREVVCHASAWDFNTGDDFRIKQCTDITLEWLLTTHHEMGHVQYYLQYKHLPIKFRRGANPGFHEAVGDVMALSVSTPEHLKEIGLLEAVSEDQGADLNFLMQQSLSKVAFLPFGLLIDQWRWDVFSGDTPLHKYNEDWWKYRCALQGVAPPVVRSEEDFDPGAKFHIPANTPYIRYFVSYILQFQLQQALCRVAGNTRPLHRCDIYNSKVAGNKLSEMLSLGSSEPWPRSLKRLTGTETLDAGALLEYFRPLYDWLVEENRGHPVGWEPQCPDGTIISSRAGILHSNQLVTVLFVMIVVTPQLRHTLF